MHATGNQGNGDYGLLRTSRSTTEIWPVMLGASTQIHLYVAKMLEIKSAVV